MTNLKVESNIDIDTSINAMIPSGALMFIGGLTYATVNNQTWIDTNGLIPCDGRAVSRTTYSNLYNAIGTTWGTGDGSTTFNVPNFYATRRFMTMPPVGSNISTTVAAANHNHSNTSISNSTGNLVAASYDHSDHNGNIVGASGGSHTSSLGGSSTNFNNSSGNDTAKAGNTSPVANANHGHGLMLYPGITSNAGGGHTHSLAFGTGASSGTSHDHTYSTSTNSISGIILEPQFVTALCFVKI